MLNFFLFFFLFPFVYEASFVDGGKNPTLKKILFAIGGFTQLIYFLLELIELYKIGKNWSAFKEYLVGWNMNDFTMPFMYTLHVFYFYYWHQYEEDRKYKAITYNLITILVLI